MKISGRQVEEARQLLGWTLSELAGKAETSEWTLRLFEETDRRPPTFVISAIRAVLESAGVIFVDENGEGPGVRLKKVRKPATSDQAAVPAIPGDAEPYDGSPV
jgi:ribosome-binding protein aMBF1 (putative translation factor)